MSTYTSTSKHEVTHKWAIQNFNDYLSFYENTEEDYNLYSSKFSLNKTDKIQFEMELSFNNTDSDLKDWLSLYIYWFNLDKLVRIKCELYILNVENKKYNKLTGIHISTRDTDLGWPEFYKKEWLLGKKELLPYNTLTIECNVIIYNEPVNILSVYERHFKCLMEDQFRKLLESEDGSDFTFEVDDYEIKAHKSILMARSPVFKAMLQSEMAEKITDRTIIKDIRPEIFKMMLEFIYTDKLQQNLLTKNDALELLAAADKYQLENLKDICGEFLHELINCGNAMEILSLAELHNVEQLVRRVKDFIKSNKQEVLSTVDSEYFVKNGHHASVFLF